MTDLNDLMVFRNVVEQGSFTAAALYIGLPKSNISRKITRLESKLGARLLERSTRTLHLTEVGRIYYEHCVRIAEELASAEQCVETLSAKPKGWIKLCSSVTLGQALLSEHLSKFSKSYPSVHLDITLTNRRVDVIEEGYDLIIRAGESPDSNLISKKLYSSQLHLYASPQYLSANSNKPIRCPDDLLGHQCLHVNAANDKARWELQGISNKTYLDFTPSLICNDFGTVYNMLLLDMGIALLPDYVCKNDLKTKKLIRVLDGWVGRTRNIYGIYPSRKGATPKMKALLNYLSQSLSITK